jgi:short-subunit dehydrogenase
MSDQKFVSRYGPWALVAGASEGIGEQFARQLAARGLNLILVARRQEVLEAVAKDVQTTHSTEVWTLVLDLARPEALAEIERATAELEIGLLVYNAAVALTGSFLEHSIEDYRTELEVNCRRPLELSHLFARAMARRSRGGILLMSSLAGTLGSPFLAHYGATKAWNTVMAEGLWGELGERGIDVLACRAGATRTPNYLRDSGEESHPAFIPVMEPADVVTEALAALGRRPSMVPGRTNRLAAGLMQRVLPRSTAVRLMGRASRSVGVGQQQKNP